MTDKQKRERQLFEEFVRLSSGLSLSCIQQPDPPAPDVLALHGGRQIGVEIVRHLQSPLKKQESDAESIVSLARKMYRESGLLDVGVSVHFCHTEPFSKEMRRSISRALCSLVSQHVPTLGEWLEIDSQLMEAPLASVVHYVRIDRLMMGVESDWRVSATGWLPDLRPMNIREIIAKKESKFNSYLPFCDEVWLLIASEGDGPSSWCKIAEDTLLERFTTRFSRVWFLNSYPRQLVEFEVRSS